MKPTIYRRVRRHPASREAASFNKEKQQEQAFFGETSHDPFFKPSNGNMAEHPVQLKALGSLSETAQIQRTEDKKEEDQKVQRKSEEEKEKIQKKTQNPEEEDKVQKKEDKEEEKVQKKSDDPEKEEKIQKKETSAATANTSANASNYISSINSKGQSMNTGVQSFYENRMGTDFSDVKIHTGKEAAESARDINAQAYAYRNHIVFNEGKYQPESNEGKHLLAHELAHVVQQKGKSMNTTNVQRTANFIASTPVYDINLADQFVKAYTNNPNSEFGSTHPLINSVDLTVSSANPIKEPVDSDLSTTAVGNEFEASVTTLPLNETSFYMRLPQMGLTKWALNVPIGNVSRLFKNQVCRISNTNIEVTGYPSNTAIITKTHVHEGLHAQHIRACHNDYIVKFDQFLTSQKAKGPTAADSKNRLLTIIAGMSRAMLRAFAHLFKQKATAFHGGASGKKGNLTTRNIAPDCSKVEITATN